MDYTNSFVCFRFISDATCSWLRSLTRSVPVTGPRSYAVRGPSGLLKFTVLSVLIRTLLSFIVLVALQQRIHPHHSSHQPRHIRPWVVQYLQCAAFHGCCQRTKHRCLSESRSFSRSVTNVAKQNSASQSSIFAVETYLGPFSAPPSSRSQPPGDIIFGRVHNWH